MAGHLILDANGRVVGFHKWGSKESPKVSPIQPPEGGSVIEVDGEGMAVISDLIRGGEPVTVRDGTVSVYEIIVGTLVDGDFEAE